MYRNRKARITYYIDKGYWPQRIVEENSFWYEKTPGIDDYSGSEFTYEYNESGYPVKVKDGEEYIYD